MVGGDETPPEESPITTNLHDPHDFRFMSSGLSALRTGTTATLWEQIRALESYKSGATRPQTVLMEKFPSDSFCSVNLPLLSEPLLRDQYTNCLGGVRFGRIIEDLDSLAEKIAFVHCNDGDPDTRSHNLVQPQTLNPKPKP